MIILGDTKLIEARFDSEQEIEDLVIQTSEHFFGPSSVLVPKKLIKTKDGFGTIPDGFAVDLASRAWYIVEAELGHHSVWTHIAPQVTKQLLAASRPQTRLLIVETIVELVNERLDIRERFEDEGIKEIDIRKVVADILGSQPIIGMPIDSVSDDLKDWAETLRNDVRLWVVTKYVQFGNQSVVAYGIPEEYRPVLDTSDREDSKNRIKTYDVDVADLIEARLLDCNAPLLMSYQPRGGERRHYEAIVRGDGTLVVQGETFSSPSYAALYCIQAAGSDRTTVNGWTSWRTRRGRTLADVRAQYLQQKEAAEVE